MNQTMLKSMPIVVVSVILVACGEDAAAPDPAAAAGPDSGAGIAILADDTRPQGSVRFMGPDGVAMDASAEEFIQQLTFPDGRMMRSSGIGVTAVPEAEIQAPYSKLHFESAATGSLGSVPAGTYSFVGELPEDIDFAHEVRVAIASLSFPGDPFDPSSPGTGNRGRVSHADAGTFTIGSVQYFDDVYTCGIDSKQIELDECTFAIGVLHGSVEFHIPSEEGSTEYVQPRTEFTIPIMRRTLIGRVTQ